MSAIYSIKLVRTDDQKEIEVPRKLHDSISLPKIDTYNAFRVISIITARQFPHSCSKYCCNCESFTRYMLYGNCHHEISCKEIVIQRNWKATYLSRRLINSIALGNAQTWNKEFTEVEYPPTFSSESTEIEKMQFGGYWSWVNRSYVHIDDLLRFLASERIGVELIDYTAPDTNSVKVDETNTEDISDEVIEQPTNGIPFDSIASQVASCSATTQERFSNRSIARVQPSALGTIDAPANVTKIRQRRFDKLAAELDEILTATPSLTPTQVMSVLIGRAGNQHSCVLGNIGDGVTWENSSGDIVTLTQQILNDRLRRRKNALARGMTATC